MHSTGPWKLTVTGTVWGLAPKGAKPADGEPDVAQGSTYADNWRRDAALIRAAPEMLTALTKALPHIKDTNARLAVTAAIRAATKPVP